MKKILLLVLSSIFLGSSVFAYVPTLEEGKMLENLSNVFVLAEHQRGEWYINKVYKSLKNLQIVYVNKYGYGFERGEVLITSLMANVEHKLPRLAKIGEQLVNDSKNN